MIFPRKALVFIFTVKINIDTFGDAYIQYHDFDNSDALFYKDKYTALLNKSYKIPIGIYMIQSQPKVIKYPLTWTLRPCLM